MCVSPTNGTAKIGSNLIVTARIRNLSTNVVFIGRRAGTIREFPAALIDASGVTNTLVLPPVTNVIARNFFADNGFLRIPPGGLEEVLVTIPFDSTLKLGRMCR